MPGKKSPKEKPDEARMKEDLIPEPSPDYAADTELKVTAQDQPGREEPITTGEQEAVKPNPGAPRPASPPPPMAPQDERTWAMLAHLSVLLNLVSGFLGMVAAIVIYFAYQNRSRFVAYHAIQSLIFQAITWIGAGLLAGIFITFGAVFGFLIIPLLCLVPGFLVLLLMPASLIYGVIGGVQVNNGEDFRYWQVGDWVRGILEPQTVKK